MVILIGEVLSELRATIAEIDAEQNRLFVRLAEHSRHLDDGSADERTKEEVLYIARQIGRCTHHKELLKPTADSLLKALDVCHN
jgi:hypothetical protein